MTAANRGGAIDPQDDPQHDLGTVRSSLRGRVEAGSYQTCTLVYKAGFAGIDDTGSLKIVTRYATDAGLPQFDDPAAANYTTAVASNGARLALRYDVKDNLRPWGRTIHCKVLQGYLKRGDHITLVLGDTSGGSRGWRMQTFAERCFTLRVLVDRYATYCYEDVGAVSWRIAAGEPERLVAVAPSLVEPAKRFVIRSKREDEWGNPIGRARRRTHPGFAKPGVYTVEVTDEYGDLTTRTNPIVVRPPGAEHDVWGRFWADIHGQSGETIGTGTIDEYFRFARDLGFLDICGHQGNDFQITDDFWQTIQETTRHYTQPGRFVAFPGWEWSGNTGLGGDRNVFFRQEGGPISRSSHALVTPDEAADEDSPNVEALFDNLRPMAGEVMLVPHVGGRYADLARHDRQLEPVVEVHSAWGTFEWMLADAFERGYRIGIVANSDGHKGRPGASYPGASTFGSYGGLTCVLAERLDRDSVWEAYLARRVYATTGARIALEVQLNMPSGDKQRAPAPQGEAAQCGAFPMGSIVRRQGAVELVVDAVGTAPIERIEVRNGMRVLKTYRTYTAADLGGRVKLVWSGAAVRGRGRQISWDGLLNVSGNRIAWAEPINFHNPLKRLSVDTATLASWESITTGGVAGVILKLTTAGRGKLEVQTAQKKFRASIAQLGVEGRAYDLGGVGKQIAVYRLPDEPDDDLRVEEPASRHRLCFRHRLSASDLRRKDNPLYVCVVQEDGHMAWSSPIYVHD